MGDYDLTNEQAVREYEGISTVDDTELITRLIERVTSRFEAYCGRQFAARDYDYATDPDNAILDGLANRLNSSLLVLPQFPIVSVTTVRINEISYDESTGIYEAGWYIHSYKSGILGLRGFEWVSGYRNIELVYNAGYGTIPGDLEEACIKQVLWHYKQGKKEHILGQSGKSLADGSVSMFATSAFLPGVKQTLDHYSRIAAI